jgi:hypothetical protein
VTGSRVTARYFAVRRAASANVLSKYSVDVPGIFAPCVGEDRAYSVTKLPTETAERISCDMSCALAERVMLTKSHGHACWR